MVAVGVRNLFTLLKNRFLPESDNDNSVVVAFGFDFPLDFLFHRLLSEDESFIVELKTSIRHCLAVIYRRLCQVSDSLHVRVHTQFVFVEKVRLDKYARAAPTRTHEHTNTLGYHLNTRTHTHTWTYTQSLT